MNNITPTGDADLSTLASLIRRLRTNPLSSSSSSITSEPSPELPQYGLSAEKLAQHDRKTDLLRDKSRTKLPNRGHRGSGAGVYPPSSKNLDPTTPRRSSAPTVDIPPRRTPSSLFNNNNYNNNDDNMSTSSASSSRPPSRADTEDTPPSSVPHTPRSETPSAPPTQEKPPIQDSVFEQLYLRIPTHTPMWVYCSELQELTTLVVISKGLVCNNIV